LTAVARRDHDIRPDELDRRLREASRRPRRGSPRRAASRPDAPPPRSGRSDRLLLGDAKTRAFGELLIDWEEDRALRAVLVGMLRGPSGARRPQGADARTGGRLLLRRTVSSSLWTRWRS